MFFFIFSADLSTHTSFGLFQLHGTFLDSFPNNSSTYSPFCSFNCASIQSHTQFKLLKQIPPLVTFSLVQLMTSLFFFIAESNQQKLPHCKRKVKSPEMQQHFPGCIYYNFIGYWAALWIKARIHNSENLLILIWSSLGNTIYFKSNY